MKLQALYILKSIEGAPETFQLLPYGRIDIEGEDPAYLDEESSASVMSIFERRGNDMVIDYEHQTLKDVQAPAAGWIKSFIDKGKEGLWAVVDWTERAKEYIAKKEYRYFSPVFWVDRQTRKVVKIVNVALTNDPKVNNLRPIIAKMDINQELSNKNKNGENRKESKMFEKLRKLFGLADDAGEDKVFEAVEAVVAKNKELEDAAKEPAEVVACKEVLDALSLDESADKTAVVAAISGLGKTGDVAQELSLEVAKLKTQIAEMKQDDLVQLALKDGKTSPEELDKWGRDLAMTNPEQFEKIVLSRPRGSVIPVDKVDVREDDGKTETADEVQLSINKMMGIDEEAWKKYNPDSQAA